MRIDDTDRLTIYHTVVIDSFVFITELHLYVSHNKFPS